jgi:heme A synthase
MLARAEHGLLPSSAEIGAQVFESLLKFHVSYLGLFLMGLALPRRSARERLLSNLCVFVQLPVGVLIYVTPPTMALALVFVRFAFFLTALLLVASIFGKTEEAEPETHAIGSGAPA